ncbi:hypothetical protein Tsubulata_022135 [Turnera subulata]|uniref:Uncharacterized protein n=1 Tax=Turnera subulata TaxID=218843 RepID=A0A9Q0FDD9_9ROSI|nr:hypothetical protein Tsubulata_022135 [Turnera subulata]
MSVVQNQLGYMLQMMASQYATHPPFQPQMMTTTGQLPFSRHPQMALPTMGPSSQQWQQMFPTMGSMPRFVTAPMAQPSAPNSFSQPFPGTVSCPQQCQIVLRRLREIIQQFEVEWSWYR